MSCWPVDRPRRVGIPETPIIWKLDSATHFEPVSKVTSVDIPWDQKKDQLVWRGSFTGQGHPDAPTADYERLHQNGDNNESGSFLNWLRRLIPRGRQDDTKANQQRMKPLERRLANYSSSEEQAKHDTGYETCKANLRCNFAYQYVDHLAEEDPSSSSVDIGFSSLSSVIIPRVLDGLAMMKPKLSMQELLQYKMILSLEGNDVASGLKWGLYSNSVILMPVPTKTTYAMEELLEPHVHYVPVARDGSDLLKKVQWVLDHPLEAQLIVKRAKQWMIDLLFHPEAAKDNALVRAEILRRYRDLWTVME